VPRNEFDVAWARQVLKESLRQTEQHCQSWGRMDLWEVLRARVIAPAFDGTAPQPYEQLAPRFGWSSAAQGSNALMTAKRLFARTLREVISEYTRDDSDVEEEIRDLRTVLSSSGARGCDLLGIT
jgi:hypothetical protein